MRTIRFLLQRTFDGACLPPPPPSLVQEDRVPCTPRRLLRADQTRVTICGEEVISTTDSETDLFDPPRGPTAVSTAVVVSARASRRSRRDSRTHRHISEADPRNTQYASPVRCEKSLGVGHAVEKKTFGHWTFFFFTCCRCCFFYPCKLRTVPRLLKTTEGDRCGLE